MRRRAVRWGVIGLLLLLGVGRLVQIELQSRPQGARGPYLQLPAPDGMTIRWQTLEPQRGVVRYGTAADRLTIRAEGAVGTLHEVRLTGLKPDSRYYYSVGGSSYAFRTSPLPGAARPVRLWIQGDPGRAVKATMQGRDAALKWAAAHPRSGLPPIDLWLTTGDNAYSSGTDSEFQQHLFNAYPRLLPSVPYLPVHGNHDARRNAFYRLFTFPERGEAGGLPSGSEHYFSIDYGQLHLLFLDTHDGDLSAGSEMLQWLKADLAATRQHWIIALLHHPPYTKGSHDSDDDGDSRGRMRRVRENVVPLLEQGGVDLALFGHSHVYERSHLMACHYGDSQSFTGAMSLQQSTKGEYRKPLQRQSLDGTLYSVVGSSYRAGKGPLDHPAMAVAMRERGSLMVDIAGDTLAASFIAPSGMVLDSYRIAKGAGVVGRKPACGTAP